MYWGNVPLTRTFISDVRHGYISLEISRKHLFRGAGELMLHRRRVINIREGHK